MKAKKVYEFINPKTDKYELEDVLPLGTKALKKIEIDDWFKTWAPNVEYTVDDGLDIKVNDYLDLSGSKVTELPDNLHINESLNLSSSDIIKLSDNMYIERNLDLWETAITKLPNNLYVGGDLNLWDTAITELPNNLYVGGDTHKDF